MTITLAEVLYVIPTLAYVQKMLDIILVGFFYMIYPKVQYFVTTYRGGL